MPFWLRNSCLVRLDIRVLDHFSPLRDFGFLECGKFLGRVASRIDTEHVEPFAYIRQRDDLDDFGVEALDDCFRRAGRHEDPCHDTRA